MNSFKNDLVVHYCDTINSIDINSEILINKSNRINEINENRKKLIQVVKLIENFNISELELKHETKISKFCFIISNDNLIGNLVIINRYLNNRSIEMINCSKPNKESIYETLLFQLIKNRRNDLVIDLLCTKENILKKLEIDGHNMIRRICGSTLKEIARIINLENISSLELRNVSIQSDQFMLCNFSGLESLSIQSSEINFSLKVENLTNLVMADFSFNNIKKINFKNLINLKSLNLKGNLIESVDDQMFKGLFKLEELDLKFNKIEEISQHSLDDLENLLKLDISQNGKIKFDCNFRRLASLRFLNLGQNSIQNIEIDSLANLEYLNIGFVKFLKLNSLYQLKFLEIDSDYVPDLSKLGCLNILVVKNVKHFLLDKNLKNLQFLIVKFDKDPFSNEAINLNSINQLDKRLIIKIESPIVLSRLNIDKYLRKTFKNFDQIEIDIDEFNQDRKVFVNMVF